MEICSFRSLFILGFECLSIALSPNTQTQTASQPESDSVEQQQVELQQVELEAFQYLASRIKVMDSMEKDEDDEAMAVFAAELATSLQQTSTILDK